MANSAVIWFIMTALWGGIGGVLPLFVPRSENRGVIQLMLMLTAACCYLMWLCTFLAQVNPLIGPELQAPAQILIRREWGN